jgi:SAM-dependent methyltransferase
VTGDPESKRLELIDGWERRAAGWGRRADRMREFGMPVSSWMIDQLALQPGQTVLELGAGAGDTGFLAAELIRPGGKLISSDAADAMVEVARARSRELGIDNVEFKRLDLEWIDLETATVDAALCRWSLMLIVDPAAALREIRRVVTPGGRIAAAVWDEASRNPWATTPIRALVELGHAEPPDPGEPGMFALAGDELLPELLEAAGFTEIVFEAVTLDRARPSVDDYIDEQLELSLRFAEPFERLDETGQQRVRERIGQLAAPFVQQDGSVRFPARSLVVAASA